MFDSLNNSKLSSLLNFKFNNIQENEVNEKGDKWNKWNEKLGNSQIKKRFETNWSEIQETAIINNTRCSQINELIINIHQNQYRQKIKLQELNTNLSYLPEVNKELKIINEKIEKIKTQFSLIQGVMDKLSLEESELNLIQWKETEYSEFEKVKVELKKKHQEQIDLFSQQMLKEYQLRMEQGNLYPLINKMEDKKTETSNEASLLQLSSEDLDDFLLEEDNNEDNKLQNNNKESNEAHPLVALEEDYPF